MKPLQQGFIVVAIRLLLLMALLCSLRAPLCRAQGDDTPALSASPTMVAASAVSHARPRDSLRDPFWPTDYIRPVLPGEKVNRTNTTEIVEAEWRAMEKNLHAMVHGVIRLPGKQGKIENLALINGKLVAVGETVSLPANGRLYRWHVISIAVPGGPVFARIIAAPPATPLPR